MTDTFVQHCISVYQALDDRGKIHELPDGKKARVFAGNYTDAYKSTGLSRTYYTSTRKALEKHNAILVVQRGGRGADTVIVLQGLPKKWDVDGWNDSGPKPLTNAPDYATLRVEVDDLLARTGGLNVVNALAEMEKRTIELETQVAQMLKTIKAIKEKK